MSKILKDTILKNKIGFHNILKITGVNHRMYKNIDKIVTKSNTSAVAELLLEFRTEPFADRAYLIKNSGEYIPYDKMTTQIKKKYIKYLDYNTFTNDILFLKTWDVRVDYQDV
jgi:hypothetical protein